MNFKYQSSIVIIFGIPGSGKSTLAQKLSKQMDSQGIKNYLIESDWIEQHLMINYQNDLLNLSESSSFVKQIFNEMMNQNINKKQNLTQDNQNKNIQSEFNKNIYRVSRKLALNLCEEIIKLNLYQFIIIDDDLILKNNRENYYKISKNLQLGYVEIRIHCELENAIRQNQNRIISKVVPTQTIINSFMNLQQHYINTIDYKNQEITDLFEEVQLKSQFILQQNILNILNEQQRQLLINNSKENIFYQLELSVRQLISQLMKGASGNSPESEAITNIRNRNQFKCIKNIGALLSYIKKKFQKITKIMFQSDISNDQKLQMIDSFKWKKIQKYDVDLPKFNNLIEEILLEFDYSSNDEINFKQNIIQQQISLFLLIISLLINDS